MTNTVFTVIYQDENLGIWTQVFASREAANAHVAKLVTGLWRAWRLTEDIGEMPEDPDEAFETFVENVPHCIIHVAECNVLTSTDGVPAYLYS
jgi:hypothetical protein